MKRNYPYTGQGAQQPAYAQPPPPAGPAPLLPASGPGQQGPYANYGYGSVAPARHNMVPMNGAGTNEAQQSQWSQQWQQQPQQYYPQQQPVASGVPGPNQYASPRPPTQSGPYRGASGPGSGSPPVNQNATYNPHQPQQPAPYSYHIQPSPIQSQSPSQHHQPPVAHAYAYTAPVPQHQNEPQNNNNAQNWPGAYASGSGQVGPPNKKPRFQTPVAPVAAPAAACAPPGVAPMAQMPGAMSGGALGQYPGGNTPSQQAYAWQGQNAAPAPHMIPRPPPAPQGPQGRSPSTGGFPARVTGRGGPSGHSARGDKAVRGAGPGNASGRGMNRNSAQNRASNQHNPSGQHNGLPLNPNANVAANAARAPSGHTRAWGSNAGQQKASALPAASGSAQHGRRASTASSIHSDKNVGGPAKNAGFGAQTIIPPNAPRGPKNASSKLTKVSSDGTGSASPSLKTGAAAAGKPGAVKKGALTADTIGADAVRAGRTQESTSTARDSGSGSKRVHTDFRILGLEIKELKWSWFAAQALGKDIVAGKELHTEDSDSKQGIDQINVESNETPAEAKQTADVDAAAKAATSTDVLDAENEDEDAEVENPDLGTVKIHDEDHNLDDEHDENLDDANAEGDEADDAEGHDDAEADANADVEQDVMISPPDIETQHPVAPAPETSSEAPRSPKAEASKSSTLNDEVSTASRGKALANLRESTKLRLCFAAMSSAAPEGAPTGPKAQIQESTPKTEGSETMADDPVPQIVKTETGDPNDAVDRKAESSDSTTAAKAETEELLQQISEQAAPSEGATAEEVTTEEIRDPAADEAEATQNQDVKQEQKQTESSAQIIHNAAGSAPKGEKTRSATAAESATTSKGPPQLPLNRIFLSFAANRKRLAIDAEAVKAVKIHRSEHWVEIRIDASSRSNERGKKKKGEGYLVCPGTLLEKRGKGQENYTAVTRSEIASAWEAAQSDEKSSTEAENEHLELPPFSRLASSGIYELTLLVKLDPSAPLPEPAWLRKNDVSSLLATLQRGSSGVAGRPETAVTVGAAQHVWAGKIEVMDPDPPPSMSTVLCEWVKESLIGSQRERRVFADELLGKTPRNMGNDVPVKAETDQVGSRTVKVEGEQGKEEEKDEIEKSDERDGRVARNLIELALRLIKGERVTVPSANASGSCCSNEPSLFAQALSCATWTTSTTYPGLVMLGLLNMALDGSRNDASAVRMQVDKLLMEIPQRTLFKAIDLTWRDSIDAGRKSGANKNNNNNSATAAVDGGVGASAGGGTIKSGSGGQSQSRNRSQQQNGNKQNYDSRGHGHGYSYGGGGQNRHGKRKRV
ncbi:uncharacterized protein MEPE_05555 [Melanopsichium pennsylvanicum]|uniref:Uncharacterized protein n=2 Tax=Melanopsichium pennsylvanicum TaxID=63383 RepID=A0AAJ4XS23_9BASI|nr:conserved hypothetical protein [Melanopsichium pennsylvanicum 4]SNX86846.1 uncharacterized protein MEPE_05555 [Melanopsichium pennsylvanicum]